MRSRGYFLALFAVAGLGLFLVFALTNDKGFDSSNAGTAALLATGVAGGSYIGQRLRARRQGRSGPPAS
jgi:hypothetical protein